MRIVAHLSVACGIVLALSACVLPQALPATRAEPLTKLRGGSPSAQGPFDFGWQLQGDRTVAPLQVFSGGNGIWLQFADIRSLPAMFGLAPDGAQQLLTFRVQPPYVYVPGFWPALRFQAGQRVAQALRVTPRTGLSEANGSPFVQPIVPVPARFSAAVANAPVAAATAKMAIGALRSSDYAVGPEDGNVRRALARWARLAGWTFEGEHWTLAADIPITARASLGTDFHQAVSALLESTEMADLPVQPCFYENQVLRVIAYAQRCDPRPGQYDVQPPAGIVKNGLWPEIRV